MARINAAEAIVQSLIAHGVDTLFCLPGIQLDPLFNALHDAGSAIRVIHTRHEQAAAYMAYGYAASTGKPGVYAVVPGPGVLNTTAALCTAYATGAPVLCLTGQIPTPSIGKGYGMLHEIPDQLGVLERLTKWARRIERVEDVPAVMAEAFAQLHTGRPRPVAVEAAPDVLRQQADLTVPPAPNSYARPALDPQALAEAARLLDAAERPMIWVGGGANDCAAEVAALAELLEAPVVSFRNGRGILPDGHALALNPPAAHKMWAEADVVLAAGSRLQMQCSEWGTDDDLKVVRIDIDPEEHARWSCEGVSLVADTRDALPALLKALQANARPRPGRREAIAAVREETAQEFAGLEPQLTLIKALREALPANGILVNEVTQISYVSYFAMPVYNPRSFITSGYQGTLGGGFATALGVKVAHPDRPVLSINGDGGFMFTAQEMATAVQHKINLVSVVFNDGAFGNVRRMQRDLHGGRLIASDLRNPDFVKFAESFGARGVRVDSAAALTQAVREGFSHDAPTLIEMPVGVMPEPFHFFRLPRVRGAGPRGGWPPT